ncbi:trypsin-like peptidase domain-containing protein [Ramlibacter sp. 2FC]|uniref:S1C family serine protease n=1 Tax=Ramlibacter sp. 2FC TaxID=2502188 RepID=UPI0010F6A0E6|nr:trypsin-like peptidase domain-containing protein [Ramlibacter sp. 2FC]
MRKTALYSRSGAGAPPPPLAPAQPPAAVEEAAADPPMPAAPRRRIRLPQQPRALWALIALLSLALALALAAALRPMPRLTQAQIDAAVRHSLEQHPLPSPATRAAEAVRPSVVRVTGYQREREGQQDKETERGVGTGVVIVDTGVILTNLHVVQGADSVKVMFADGLEATASVTGLQTENDLAVLQAHKIPDDLHAATLRGTGGLLPGDQVVAVGFPFGIGPSVSAGVVSGLQRTFRSPVTQQRMSNLIQFDAAANPGNSGGPLVTMEGEVVGIVTAILNPTPARTFIGIGFAVPIENAASAVGMHPF